MGENKKNTFEMFYTLTCPICKILEKMLKEVLHIKDYIFIHQIR
jgi:thioredoxin-related protein